MQNYSLIMVGTGFASSFFLQRYLKVAGPRASVLVLERGPLRDHRWYVENRDKLSGMSHKLYENKTPKEKPWRFVSGFGGSSNCWWGCTPRMLPDDFVAKTKFGVTTDWPVNYEDLESYYCDVEETLGVAGPDNTALFPRSRPYPMPPHRLSRPDEAMIKAYPGLYFAMPTARASQPFRQSPPCCASGVCGQCPINAKATVLNRQSDLYDDPRVTRKFDAKVTQLDHAGTTVKSVEYEMGGEKHRAAGDFVALGANAIFNAGILLRSGITDHVGKGLVEQASVSIMVKLDGMESMQGGTSLTAHGYMLYAQGARAERAPILLESNNNPRPRMERGKWRMVHHFKAIIEDLRRDENEVSLDPKTGVETTRFVGVSDYTQKATDALDTELSHLLSPLPVEKIEIRNKYNGSESHIMGTVPMGSSPAHSAVDHTLRHHRLRNLAVLGASAFPTAAPANPTLTLSALSMRSAQRIFGK